MSDDSFLSRWSRRKRHVEPDAGEAAPSPEPAPQDAEQHAAVEEEGGEQAPAASDAEVLEALGLKDPDLLGPDDDFSGYLAKAVPEHLRRKALRRLWISNPVLANLDGLNDYDGDFTGGSVGPGLLKTAYRVGLGFPKEETVPETASDQVAADSPDSDHVAGMPSTATSAGAIAASDADADAEGPDDMLAEAKAVQEPAGDDRSNAVAPRRRMKFSFEG